MPRPSKLDSQRKELLPVVARAFGELGYHRATTAELSRRCGVQETILYRLWADKKAMFLAAIRWVVDLSIEVWSREASRRTGGFSIEDALRYEAAHIGEFGHHRLIFAGLSETDDPEIRESLAEMYRSFHRFIEERIVTRGSPARGLSPEFAAWALIGLGTVATIGRETGVLGDRTRRRMFEAVGGFLAGVPIAEET